MALGKVCCVTLREIIDTNGIRKINFLKIDTEGNDYNVLKGMGNYLDPNFTEIVYLEMSSNRRAIYDLMDSKGYIGFAYQTGSRRGISQAQHLYEAGGQPCFFVPLTKPANTNGDVLWCDQDSFTASFLNRLHSSTAKSHS